MQKMRAITLAFGALALVASAAAQFDGPAPLAWRWIQPSRVGPGGSPLVNGDTIYQSLGGRVYCIDRVTGNRRWQYPQLDPISGTFRSTPLLIGDTLVMVGDNKIVYAVDANTGSPKWTSPLTTGSFGAPVAVGNAVVIALSDNSLVALNSADGTPLWQNSYKVFDGIQGSLASYGNNVVFFTNRDEIYSVNVATQRSDWHQRLTQVNPNPQATVFGDTIYLNSGPYLVGLNSATGTARFSIATNLQLISAPVVGNSGILLVSQDNKAIVIDPVSRRPVNAKPIDLGSAPIVRPTAVGSMFVVPTANGALNLIDPTKADPQWIYVVRPLADAASSSSSSSPRGPGGPGGPAGGGFGGFGGGGLGGGQTTNNDQQKPVVVQAAAPVVLSGQTLLVPAKDGSLLAFDKDLGVDLTPPKVDMLFPTPGDQVSGQPPLLFYFRISDESSGLRTNSLKVEVNGQPLDYTLNRDGTVVVRFTLTGKNKPLSDGRKEVAVTATDWMGNTVRKTFSLSIDNALPPIQLPGQSTNNNNFGGPPGKGGGGLGGD